MVQILLWVPMLATKKHADHLLQCPIRMECKKCKLVFESDCFGAAIRSTLMARHRLMHHVEDLPSLG